MRNLAADFRADPTISGEKSSADGPSVSAVQRRNGTVKSYDKRGFTLPDPGGLGVERRTEAGRLATLEKRCAIFATKWPHVVREESAPRDQEMQLYAREDSSRSRVSAMSSAR